MATYIPGAKQFVPNVQPFTPDYKFLSNVLQTKETRYDAGYKALNDIYGKVVYADLSRGDTREVRDQFANQLGPKLEKISGLDLSLSQNVQAAKGIFQPFFEEDLIVRDLVNTQAYRDQVRYANLLQTSPDKSQRQLWWSTGVEEMQYRMEDFINATPEEALNMAPVRYTVNPDLYQKTLDFFEEQGFNVSREIIGPSGNYRITTNTGDDITEAAFQMAYKALADDPQVINGYFTDAYVRSRRYADQAIESGLYNSVPEARRAWAIETINGAHAELGARLVNQKNAITAAEANIRSWEDYKKQVGIIPGSMDDMAYRKAMSMYQTLQQQYEDTASTLAEDEALKNSGSLEGLTNRAYNMLMQTNMRNDIFAAVQNYMKLNEQIEIKEDQFALEKQKHKYNLIELQVKSNYDRDLKILEAQLEGKGAINPMAQAFATTVVPGGAGATSYMVDEDGDPIDPKDFDYISSNTTEAARFAEDIYEESVNAVLNFIDKAGEYKDGYFQYNSKNYTSETLRDFLLQRDENGNYINSQDGEQLFETYYNNVTKGTPIGLQNNKFVDLASKPDLLSELMYEFENVNGRKLKLDKAIMNANKSYQDILTTAIDTEDGEGLRNKAEEYGIDIPSIIATTRNGASEVLSYDDFLISYGQQITEAYLNSEGYSSTGNPDYKKLPGVYKNRQILLNRAAKEVREIYNAQRDLINGAIGGVLSVDPQKGDVSAQVYKPVSVNAYMYDQPQTAGDMFVGPVYQSFLDPNSSQNAGEALYYNRQISLLGEGEIFYHMGDIGKQENVDIEETDPIAEAIAEQWAISFRQNIGKESKVQDLPTANLKYAPIYGPRDEKAKNTAAYVLEYNAEWLSGLKDKVPGLTEDNLTDYTTVSILFNQNKDINPKRLGAYNFSPYLTQVDEADNNMYKMTIPNGGEYEIVKRNGEYRMSTYGYQYNMNTGSYETLNPITINLTQEAAQRNLPVEEYTNGVVREINKRLFTTANSNLSAKKSNYKSQSNQ